MPSETFDHRDIDRFAHNWARDLPFPLATVGWLYRTSFTPAKQLDSLFDFLEVAVRLVGIINLSALRADRGIYLGARGALQGVGDKPSVRMQMATPGTWVKLDAALASALRRLSEDQRRDLYKVERATWVEPLISRRLSAVFEDFRQARNDWRAHDGATNDRELDRRLAQLENLAGQFWTLTQEVWGRWFLVRPGAGTYRRGVHVYELEILTGERYPFRREKAEFATNLEDQNLYFWNYGATSALHLVPLLRILPTGDDEEGCYFYDRMNSGQARWLSYHYGGSERPLEPADPDLIEVIDDLDEPGGDGPDSVKRDG